MNIQISIAARRGACLIAVLVMAIPGAAYGQQSDRTAGGGFGRARRFFDPSTWTKPRAATAGEGRVVRAQDAPAARDPRLQLARQEPDLAVPAADRALGGGDPVIGDVPQPTPPDPSAPVGDPSGAGTSPGTPDLAAPSAGASPPTRRPRPRRPKPRPTTPTPRSTSRTSWASKSRR